ncbi:hypothetical protein [Nocardia sp. SYP-A9097]|nr:hypothetical protein [Nocardia sp. SYP-A9097]
MPEHEPRGKRDKWKDRAAKWGPLVLAIGRFVQDITDRLLG